MASEEKLTIHKLVFNLHVADKETYTHFANRISKLCSRALPRRLDGILKKYKIPNGRIIIKKLDINLGDIAAGQFEKTIIDAIAKEFEAKLKKYIEEITEQIKTAKFRTSAGGRIEVTTSAFSFESEIYIQRSVLLKKEVQESLILDPSYIPVEAKRIETTTPPVSTLSEVIRPASIDLASLTETSVPTEVIEKTSSRKSTIEKRDKTLKHPSRALSKAIKEENEKQVIAILSSKNKLPVQEKIKAIQFIKNIPKTVEPKALTELEKIFLYHIRYGRLPSNIKYELGMQMVDILNINQLDIRFFNDLKRHVESDVRAKERLIRITDQANKASLLKKQIIGQREIDQYDPKIPKSFEDYFTALLLERDLYGFTPELRRYNLNDMIRFFYADHPQKLRAILKFLLVDFPSDETTSQRVKKLFSKIGKSSIVKIIGSFVRKAGYVNKSLNQLNKSHQRGIKDAHEAVLLAFLLDKNPIQQLIDFGFETENLEDEAKIEPRIFLSQEPQYNIEKYDVSQLLDYFLKYGTLPHSSMTNVTSIEKLSFAVLLLSNEQIRNIAFFKERQYEQNFKHSGLGQFSDKTIEHLLKALVPDMAADLMSKFMYFKLNIKSGVPEAFQKGFLIYYALKTGTKSYFEEMVDYWKKVYGDANTIIKRRWNVNEELEKELNKLLHIKEKTLEEQIKVDAEFVNYSQDISVKNAGLVLLWPFLKVYFNMLDLLNEKGDFRSIDERARACHLLQYLAVKQSGGEEFYYPLNKILTGYPLDEPLPYEITMTQKEIDVSNALLKNIIKQWNALKGSSVDALRGSFLIRDGILVPAPNGWLLTVEKKAYDILLDKLPWGIGMIKLSWAPYVLSVEWDRNIM